METKTPLRIAIVGGGAAGFFGALRAAEVAKAHKLAVEISIFEATSQALKKVRISGGGRCNVTHNCFDPKQFVQNYPRGFRELISPLQKFQAKDTIEWFAKRDIKIVTEEDGRMFPSTNTSETIINCYKSEAEKLGVNFCPHYNVQEIKVHRDETKDKKEFRLKFKNQPEITVDRILIATGSMPSGHRLACELGHKITDLAPSLFSFKINSPLLTELSGTSFGNSQLKLNITPEASSKKTFKQRGPLLITHWGLSGPAILKLSAWAAREMKHAEYKAQLTVNWLGLKKIEEAQSLLNELKNQNPKSQVKNICPQNLTKRFWHNFLANYKVDLDTRYTDLSKKQLNQLADGLFNTAFDVLGKNRYKDEFVECGGISLKEIDFKTMQSKICQGLYFAGEVLDIDGITGGFNFQNAWTTSWIAGGHMVLQEQAPQLVTT